MSLRVLTVLLVVLVLVPAGVLAWLGWQGASAWDEAVQARIDAEIADGRVLLRDRMRQEAALVEAALRTRLETIASATRRELPRRGVGGGMLHVARLLPGTDGGELPLYDLRLLDSDGRTIWPATYTPDEPASDEPLARFAFDVQREAERLRYPAGDPAAARARWQEVADRAPSVVLRAWARGQAALIPDAAGDFDPSARARELLASMSSEEQRSAARPLALLLFFAAEQDQKLREELRRRWLAGELAGARLTDEERRRGARIAWPPQGEVAPAPAALRPAPTGVRTIPLGTPVADGAQIEARIPVEACWSATVEGLMRSPWGSLEGYAAPRLPSPMEQPPHDLHSIRVPGAFGVEGRLVFHHREQAAFDEARRLRRALTSGGVIALVLLMLVGLFVVRRAVARERSASRLRDDFIANVSHELRTPLASVLLHAELLGEPEVTEARRQHLTGVLHAEGVRLQSLVEDLLDFEALSSGKRASEPEPIDLGAAVARAALPYETLAERDGVELIVSLPKREVVALADSHAVARILANLLANAWRHGRPSRDGAPGRIAVGLVEGLPLETVVEVSDDGPGIEASEQEAVFERFRRGSGSRSVRGTGLGLALSRDLARAMEGELSLEVAGGRTVFRLRLPLHGEGAT